MIDIKGIDKAALLAALVNGTRPLGLGVLHDKGPMTIAEAQKWIDEGRAHDTAKIRTTMGGARLYFDYVAGRPIKVDIGGDEAEPQFYDRDAPSGPGSFARIVESLRNG